jgi:hypothetical protein
MKLSSPFILRAAVAACVGAALGTGWLYFILEVCAGVLDHGKAVFVYTPRWWVVLELLSLSALVIFAFALRRRDRGLAAISWGGFGFGLLGTIMLLTFGHGISCVPIDLAP